MRETAGTASLRISRRFPLSATCRELTPVMLPPGCARLAMNPEAPGSPPPPTITMGTVLVARWAARIAAEPTATSTSTRSRTRSAASSGSRS
jgi:hypothetical protein